MTTKKLEADLKKVEEKNPEWSHPSCPRCGGILTMESKKVLKCTNCRGLCQLVSADA